MNKLQSIHSISLQTIFVQLVVLTIQAHRVQCNFSGYKYAMKYFIYQYGLTWSHILRLTSGFRFDWEKNVHKSKCKRCELTATLREPQNKFYEFACHTNLILCVCSAACVCVCSLNQPTVHPDSWLVALFCSRPLDRPTSRRGRCPRTASDPESSAPTGSLRRPTVKTQAVVQSTSHTPKQKR